MQQSWVLSQIVSFARPTLFFFAVPPTAATLQRGKDPWASRKGQQLSKTDTEPNQQLQCRGHRSAPPCHATPCHAPYPFSASRSRWGSIEGVMDDKGGRHYIRLKRSAEYPTLGGLHASFAMEFAAEPRNTGVPTVGPRGKALCKMRTERRQIDQNKHIP